MLRFFLIMPLMIVLLHGEVPVTSVVINKSFNYTAIQDKFIKRDKLTAKVIPENATNKIVTWSSSNENIATVDEYGNITGISEGEVTIKASAGGQSDTHTIQVMQPYPKIDVYTAKEVDIDDAKNHKGKKLIIKPAYLHDNYGTDIYYMLYLPETWEDNPDKRYPVFVDFQGMDWEPRKAILGEALSYEFEGIWVGVCPIDANPEYDEDWTYDLRWDKKDDLTGMRVGGWWPKGGEGTPDFLIRNIREICEKFHGNTGQIFPIGISKGAVCVNFYGNYNDEVADIWRGYFQHDGGIDGLRRVNNAPSLQAIWDGTVDGDGSFARLERINGRPYLLTDFTYLNNYEWFLGDTTHYSNGEATGRDYLGEHPTNPDYYVGEFQLRKWETEDAERALHGVAKFANAHTAEHLYSRIDYAQYTFEWFRKVINGNIGCYHVSGRVTNANGDPVVGEYIEGGGIHFAITNSNGEYFLEGLPQGQRTISCKQTEVEISINTNITGINFIATDDKIK